MRGLFSLLLLFCLVPTSGYSIEQDTYTTSMDATFARELGQGEFGEGWRAPNGVLWGRVEGLFSNDGPYDSDGEVLDSSALHICQSKGGRLPGYWDFVHFSNFFERHVGLFNKQGRKDVRTLFPGMQRGDKLWTSTVRTSWEDNGSTRIGYVFNASVGGIMRQQKLRSSRLWVICIQD